MLSSLIISVLLPTAILLIVRIMNEKHKPPILGVYQQRNKYFWLKFVFMYCVLVFRKLTNHVKWLLQMEYGNSGYNGEQIHTFDFELEKKFDLGGYNMSADAVYFNAMSKESSAFVCGLARRPKNICDAFLMLRIAGQDLYLSPELPDTYLEQSLEEQGNYQVKNIKIENVIPMRSWKISYNGEMKSQKNPEKRVKVQASLLWSARFPPFNFDTQMSAAGMARDMAREPWSRDYFKHLKKNHQTHYEQAGNLKGTVSIDGQEHCIDMPCVRDHSGAKLRDWRNFHRYVYHFIFLENGEIMAVGTISQPLVLSHLTVGYYCKSLADQEVFAVDSCDFQLYQHGENQVMPKDYGFSFTAGGETHVVHVKSNQEATFFIGKDREAKFYERWSDVNVDGKKGWACVEWYYNNEIEI